MRSSIYTITYFLLMYFIFDLSFSQRLVYILMSPVITLVPFWMHTVLVIRYILYLYICFLFQRKGQKVIIGHCFLLKAAWRVWVLKNVRLNLQIKVRKIAVVLTHEKHISPLENKCLVIWWLQCVCMRACMPAGWCECVHV